MMGGLPVRYVPKGVQGSSTFPHWDLQENARAASSGSGHCRGQLVLPLALSFSDPRHAADKRRLEPRANDPVRAYASSNWPRWNPKKGRWALLGWPSPLRAGVGCHRWLRGRAQSWRALRVGAVVPCRLVSESRFSPRPAFALCPPIWPRARRPYRSCPRLPKSYLCRLPSCLPALGVCAGE